MRGHFGAERPVALRSATPAGATVARLADVQAPRLGFARLSAPFGAEFKSLLRSQKTKTDTHFEYPFLFEENL